MEAMARIEQNCSEEVGILTKGVAMVRELHRAGYPNREIKTRLRRMSRKGGKSKVWRRIAEIINL